MEKLRQRLGHLFVNVVLIIIIGTLFYALFEDWNFIDAFYFTVMTLTTVGYGDMYPTSSVTKLFTVAYVLVGVYLLLYTLRVLTSYYFEKKTPNIRRAVTQTLEHLVAHKKSKGDVVIKVPKSEDEK